MKKRIIAAMLISAVLAASFTACSSTPSESVSSVNPDEKPGEVTQAVATNPTESAASGGSVTESADTKAVQSETTPAETEVEEVKEQLKLDIRNDGFVNNGSWYFQAENNDTYEHYLYNFADKKLVKLDVEEGYEVGDISGYKVLLLNRSSKYGVIRGTGKLIDAKSNSALTEDMLFIWNGRNGFFANDTLLVGKYEASFSSTTNSLGLINSSGEWIYPLSSETALNDIESFELAGDCNIINLGNEYVQFENYYYSLKTNSVVENININNWLLLEEDQGYGIKDRVTLCKYDFNTNEMTEIAKGLRYQLYDAKNKTIYMCDSNDHGTVYDFKTNKFTELTNLLGEPTAFFNGILINTQMTGADGNPYFGAYNLNSEFVFEPIMSEYDAYSCIVPVGEKVIIKVNSPNSALYVLDTTNNTLSTVEIDDSFDYASFIAVNDDTVIVEKDVDRRYKTYFLADINDLTKTYSPFDA